MNALAVMALATVLGAAPDAGADAIDIASESTCPTAALVRAALQNVSGTAHQRRARVVVRDSAVGLSLEFRWEGEGASDLRAVPAPADCAPRAQAAAVVISSWLGVLPAAPAPPPPPVVAAPAPPAVVAAASSASQSESEAERRWWLGVGLGAAAGGGVAPGARVELARTRAMGPGLGWLVALQGTLPRSRAIGGGTSSWVRPALGVAGLFSWPVGRTVVAADVGPLVAATLAWGSGYPSNRTDQGLSLGLCAGVRLQLGTGPSRPWVEVRFLRWLTAHRLLFESATTGSATADLPVTEGVLTLGWSLPLP